ncbi:MAG: hypothetical protein Tsb002_11240 [Wenzhouxiangellaceae bacterium]
MVSWKIPTNDDGHALDRLQRVQESVYGQLQCLVPDWQAQPGSHWCSKVKRGQPLHLILLERHTYTSYLRLTHHFDWADEAVSEPEAHIRCYHDARLAEVTAFDTIQGIRRLAHPSLPAKGLMRLAWRRNQSLAKWLIYLLQQGHGRESMHYLGSTAEAGARGGKKALLTV